MRYISLADISPSLSIEDFKRVMDDVVTEARNVRDQGGLKQDRRRLLMKIVTLIAIYAAPIWAGAINNSTYRTGIDAAYISFRTVSTDATVVIADDAMDKWLQDWTSSNKGRRTYRLILRIGEWTKRSHG